MLDFAFLSFRNQSGRAGVAKHKEKLHLRTFITGMQGNIFWRFPPPQGGGKEIKKSETGKRNQRERQGKNNEEG